VDATSNPLIAIPGIALSIPAFIPLLAEFVAIDTMTVAFLVSKLNASRDAPATSHLAHSCPVCLFFIYR